MSRRPPQGMSSATDRGVCPYWSRSAFDGPFCRRRIRPASITTSWAYRWPSIWTSPNATSLAFTVPVWHLARGTRHGTVGRRGVRRRWPTLPGRRDQLRPVTLLARAPSRGPRRRDLAKPHKGSPSTLRSGGHANRTPPAKSHLLFGWFRYRTPSPDRARKIASRAARGGSLPEHVSVRRPKCQPFHPR